MSSPPWTYQGPLYGFSTSVVRPVRFTYMQTFFGASGVPATLTADLRLCVGLRTADGNQTLQTIVLHPQGAPVNQWVIYENWVNNGVVVATSAQTNITEPIGVWGVIAFQNANQWVMRSYRGLTGNTGPQIGRPVSAGLVLPVSPTTNSALLNQTMEQAICNIEVPPPPTPPSEPGYACNDIAIHSLFGHTELRQGAATFPPVNWVGANSGLPNGGVTCTMNGKIVAG